MYRKTVKFVAIWAVLLLVGITMFNFLHECGHGFGAQLDGKHISTGFNKVGDTDKKPSDPDFRAQQVETGLLDSSGILGPFTNWTLAILFTVWLLRRSKSNFATMAIGAAAVSNAVNRLSALISFFIGSLHNTVHLADEVEWGLKTTKGLDFPMNISKITSIADTQPSLILSNPRVYFWPAVSMILSAACFIIAYKKLYKAFGPQMESKLSRWIFGLMPVVAGIILLFVINVLDNVVRINW